MGDETKTGIFHSEKSEEFMPAGYNILGGGGFHTRAAKCKTKIQVR